MLYTSKPADFNQNCVAVSCVIQCGAEVLLVHRAAHRPYPNKWVSVLCAIPTRILSTTSSWLA